MPYLSALRVSVSLKLHEAARTGRPLRMPHASPHPATNTIEDHGVSPEVKVAFIRWPRFSPALKQKLLERWEALPQPWFAQPAMRNTGHNRILQHTI